MDRSELLDEFRFLADKHGFSEVPPENVPESDATPPGPRVEFAHPKLRIVVSHNARDGFDCSLIYPGDSAGISLGVLMSALRPDGSRGQSSFVSPGDQSDFLRTRLARLLDIPPQTLDDCRALRFYHAGPWRTQWGHTIQMDPESIRAERARLDRLRGYFRTIP